MHWQTHRQQCAEIARGSVDETEVCHDINFMTFNDAGKRYHIHVTIETRVECCECPLY